jgi:hypothetical protein
MHTFPSESRRYETDADRAFAQAWLDEPSEFRIGSVETYSACILVDRCRWRRVYSLWNRAIVLVPGLWRVRCIHERFGQDTAWGRGTVGPSMNPEYTLTG